jgi:gliding motility-associated lipoprotein GldD
MKNNILGSIRNHLSGVCSCILVLLLTVSCKEPLAPKPRAYFRIDFPEKKYVLFKSECKFSFEYPCYGHVNNTNLTTAEPCWYNINFNDFKATIYLTYKPLINDNLSIHIEDVRRIVYKHIIKADDIIETSINIPERKVYGMIYDIQGNAASAVNFYITDSITGFLSGSLYFNLTPNKDSLAPAIQFFREDIVHLIQTFSWK